MKFTPAGIPVWTNVIPKVRWGRLVADRLGRAFVAWATNAWATNAGVALLKYDRDGTPLWTKRYDHVRSVDALAVDSRGAVYLAGETAASWDGRVVVVKTSSQGQTIWSAATQPSFNGDDMTRRFGRVDPQSVTLVQDIGSAGHYDKIIATFREQSWRWWFPR